MASVHSFQMHMVLLEKYMLDHKISLSQFNSWNIKIVTKFIIWDVSSLSQWTFKDYTLLHKMEVKRKTFAGIKIFEVINVTDVTYKIGLI